MTTLTPALPANINSQHFECPICLTLFFSKTDIQQTICNHTFCKSCIQTWTLHNITCPICRCQIKSGDLIPPYDTIYNRDINTILSLANRKPEQARQLYTEYMKWLQGTRNSRPIVHNS